jgi:tetratricopeptide (TPR) repeat protein
MNAPPARFYVAGGTLARDAPCYIVRRADRDLVESLTAGEFCYVLTSRQMGKSSLMVRAATALRAAGRVVLIIDLQRIGNNVSLEQWYAGLLDQIGAQLDLEDELEEFWFERPETPPLQRWNEALEWLLEKRPEANFVIFIDEIDFVRSLPFRVDEFFAAIRGAYNSRAIEPKYGRLTFCLLGVATPAELIVDPRTTPFNIGRRIDLDDFTLAEATALAPGLNLDLAEANKVIERAIHWTDGHPYLTQRLLTALTQRGDAPSPKGIDRLCDDLFFSEQSRERDDNLLFVRDRILRLGSDLAGLLSIYGDILRRRAVRDDEADSQKALLKLSGIVSVRDGRMLVRNRIYRTVFDTGWVRENMPDAERRRQRRAFFRGLAIAGALGLLVAAGFAGLGAYAWREQRQAEAHLRNTLNVLSRWTGHLEESLDDPKITVYMLKRFVAMIDEAGVRDMLGDLGDSASESRRYARSLHRSLIRIQYRAGDSQLSLKYIDERLATLRRLELSEEDERDLIWNLGIKGRILRRMARYGDALASFDQAIDRQQRLGLKARADDRRSLASNYLARGQTSAEFGEFENADQDFRAAEAIYAARLGDGQGGAEVAAPRELMDYGRFLRAYGDLLAFAGRHNDATAKYAQARGIYTTAKNMIGDKQESVEALRLRRHWIDLVADESLARAQQGGATQVPDELIQIADEVAKEAEADPENLLVADRAGSVHHALAALYQKAGRLEQGLAAANVALSLRKLIADSDLLNTEWQRNAAEAGLLAAHLQAAQEGPNGAVRELVDRQYREVILRLTTVAQPVADEPSADLDVPSLRMLARAERSYADYLRARGDADGALRHYEAAVAHGRHLLAQVNDNAYWRVDLAESLAGLARAHWQAGATEAALAPLTEARKSRLDWLKRDPADSRRIDAFVGDTKVMSSWLSDRGEKDGAKRLTAEAKTVLTELKNAGKLPPASWERSLRVLAN